MEKIVGYIENIVFTAVETGFTVARLKEPRKKDLTTIVGAMPGLQPGETVSCEGHWKHHSEHGTQFLVENFESRTPSDLVGIQKYLESGLIKGIGPVYAKRIVEKYGTATLETIDRNPRELLGIEGIGEKRMFQIETCWQEQRSIREVMVFLRKYNISPSYANKIYKTYGENSIKRVKDNPFTLAKDIRGIGFKSADAIAHSLGIDKSAPVRIQSGIEHILWELSSDGHVCYPKTELIEKVSIALEVETPLVIKELSQLLLDEDVVERDEKIWTKPLYFCETGIAKETARISQSLCAIRNINQPKAIQWVQERLRLRLAKEQKTAVTLSTSEKMHIITGGPGTGKSTITKAILAISYKLTDKILLAAPTGRAAKRMSEITRRKAFTIHALLSMDFRTGQFKYNRDNPLDCHLLIIDEASMIDTQLMYALLKAVPNHARVILIGDIDQLPSVGPGNVLKEMIASERIPVTCLKFIFRQAKGSRIITNSHSINAGYFPDLEPDPKSDFQFIEEENPEKILSTIVGLMQHKLPKTYRSDDIQVLSPMKRGIIGTENLNYILQKTLNPSSNPLIRMGRVFHINDKVMQISNNYQKEVYNGDVGKIVQIDTVSQEIEVSFDGRIVLYDFLDLDELILAYAVSIHKYQGSECPCIIIPVHTCHFKMLHRNLIYTGITRGKNLVILIGSKKALAIAVHNDEVKARHTGLISSLQEFLIK